MYYIQSTILYIFRITCLFKPLVIHVIPGTSLVFQTVCVSTLLRYSHHQIFIFIGKLLLLVVGNVCAFKKWHLFDSIYYLWKLLYIYNVLLHLLPRYLKFHLVSCNIPVTISSVIARDIFVYCINILKYFIGCLFIALPAVNNTYLIVLYKNSGCFFSGPAADVGDEHHHCIPGRSTSYRDPGSCG